MTIEPKQRDPADGLRERLAVNLRAAREAAGLTQEELGERCGMHWTAVARLEEGRQEPSLGAALRLAGALGVAPESLWAQPA
jgi:transcriptional regulator with XRE-family HTH domain